LRSGAVHRKRGARSYGLLPLRVLPALVGRASNVFTLWKPEAVQITQGGENIRTYSKTPNSYRKWCKTCGGHIFSEHPGWKLMDVYAATIPDFPFRPGIHVHYQETVLPIKDGLPKMKDLPKEMGGSGITVEE
jgi:hypothetical protein